MDNPVIQTSGLLLDLLLQIAVSASAASLLVRSRKFKLLLFQGRGSLPDTAALALFFVLAFGPGVALRLLLGYRWSDVSTAASILAGLVGGPAAGALVGGLLGLSALARAELLAPVFMVAAGLAGGGLRATIPKRDGVWSFSPFTIMSTFRFIRAWPRSRRPDWRLGLVLAAIVFELAGVLLHRRFPALLAAGAAPHAVMLGLVLVKAVMCIGIPIKIWNNTRIEILLEEQEAALLRTRYDALKRQIHPHFLFNTLNTIASLIRTNPASARETVIRLSQILRQLLQENDEVPLRHELEFIDAYLSIEEVRFGKGTLRIVKEIDPRALDVKVPSMLLQPVVENAVKHGISRRVGGGTITMRAELRGSAVVIEVADDGEGVAPGARFGIGLRNVNERLRVCYGEQHALTITPGDAGGTVVRLSVPAGAVRQREVEA